MSLIYDRERGLLVPQTFLEAPPELIAQVCNGCGPGGAKVDLVPDELVGLEIGPLCDYHDWMYHEGVDRALADSVFLFNMVQRVRRTPSSPAIKAMRLAAAWRFYMAVAAFGGNHFGGARCAG